MKITDTIKYAGVNDHQVDLFEGQYAVPNGMAYNSYVILDEKVAVMDTVDANFKHEWLDNLEQVLDGFDIEINDRIPTEFYCNCSKERVEKALISIGRKELNEMIQEGKEVELNCHFCNTNYTFSVEELKEILRKCK